MEINYTSSGIPKIIHQTWKTKDVPDHWKKSKDEWQRLHPDWLYILWTDEDIRNHIKDHHPDFLELHDNYEYNIQRADMIRYFILYDFGGVYCDLDLYPTENIEKYLTNSNDYFVYSANLDTITNCFMISLKNSIIMKTLINHLKDKLPWFAFGKHLKVHFSTGPNFVNEIIKNKINVSFTILPKQKFNPYSSSEDIYYTNDINSIVIMPIINTSGSWHEFDSKCSAIISRYKPFFIFFGILSLFMIIFGLIYYISKYKKCRESKVCIKQ
jgi:mannosyltransferase OCH1-like enzyme